MRRADLNDFSACIFEYFRRMQRSIEIMKSETTVGIPKGLLFSYYHIFAETLFDRLGFNVVISPDTNKDILEQGVKNCVDDACLPIKVFHGHVNWLKTRCDVILMPRFLSLEKGKKLCPMFCGLTEMVKNSITHLPSIIDTPVFSLRTKDMYIWSLKACGIFRQNRRDIDKAFSYALLRQKESSLGICDTGYPLRVALIGHAYIVHDAFVSMNVIRRLRAAGVGVVTAESVSENRISQESGRLFKPPFWYFAQAYFGAAVSLYRQGTVDGLIYLSSFSCGVDSVFAELIRLETEDLPFMVLKFDEHTGEAAVDTRIEAFADMLKRRVQYGHHFSAYGQRQPCGESVF